MNEQLDLELCYINQWNYPYEEQITPAKNSQLFPSSSVPFSYAEVKLIPNKIRAHLVENSHLCLGEKAVWTVNNLIPDGGEALAKWLGLAMNLGYELDIPSRQVNSKLEENL